MQHQRWAPQWPRRQRSRTMRTLGLALLLLLLLTAVKGEPDNPETQFWTCGYRGLCRRFCYAQEYVVGYHGCPRRYRCCAMRI
uniref:Defensin, beta-like 2 n=1 Tax=Scleropages formosus TaxID=113540 RepID=A0A8C9WPY9_SCLFO